MKAGRELVLGEQELMQKQTVKQPIPVPDSSGNKKPRKWFFNFFFTCILFFYHSYVTAPPGHCPVVTVYLFIKNELGKEMDRKEVIKSE